jgi:hypothetical protein
LFSFQNYPHRAAALRARTLSNCLSRGEQNTVFAKMAEIVGRVTSLLVGLAFRNLDVAAARYEAAERQAGLAEARKLKASSDPGEKALGEELEARILQGQPLPLDFVVDGPEANGATLDPLPARSSQALPGAALGLPALEHKEAEPKTRGPGRPRKSESNHQLAPSPPLEPTPPRPGPGRPRKNLPPPKATG